MSKALELVPFVVDSIDLGLVGAGQALFELQIIGGVGKDQVHRGFGKRIHVLDAVTNQDRVDGEVAFFKPRRAFPRR